MRTLPLFALFSSLLYLAGCAGTKAVLPIDSPYVDPTGLEKGQILHLKTGRLLSEVELFNYLSHFPVVYVGESHDNADDHAVQLSVLKALEERFPGRVSLGMEMLRRPAQPKVDAYIEGKLDEKEFVRVWYENWRDSFPDYRDLLHFAREKKIPVVALNASDDVKADVKTHAFKEVPAATAKELPEIDADDPYHRAVAEGMLGGHSAGTGDSSAFYRVMLLWDETMAQTAADYLKSAQGRGRVLVVLAGGNHVRYGIGIPRRVFRRLPVPYVVVEPYANPAKVEIPEEKRMDVELPVLPLPEADVLWSVGYRVLNEPKVMLGVQIEDADKKGVRVTGVLPDSPALKAGIEKGDVIVAVDGVEVKEPFDLTYQVRLHKPGEVGPVEVLRADRKVTVQLTYDVLKHGQ